MLFEKLKAEVHKYFIRRRINFDLKYENNYVKYVYLICPFLGLNGEEKQNILEHDDLYDRLKKVHELILKRNDESKNEFLGSQELVLNPKISDVDLLKNRSTTKRSNNIANSIEDFENKINSANMTEEAKNIAFDELDKLKNSPEKDYIINYLNTLINLPWDKMTTDNEDINRTKEILDRDHFGLQKVKKRIIEYLSVRKLNTGNKKGSILCFNGPPGVGKTSLAKSIADSLGKNFYRLSLGGVRDEAEIRGHRRTYVASMPGNIIQALLRLKSKNPVILLDEIDKVGSSNLKGDVSSALLEVLDPEQNDKFKDHYINTSFDLSHVFFVCTSNYIGNISPPLRDRLELIEIPGYSIEEKVQICKRYLIPKHIKEKGLLGENLSVGVQFSDDIIESMIIDYTYESGVRQLERNVSAVLRHVARLVVEEMDSIFKNNSSSNDNNKIILTKNFNINYDILKEALGRRYLEIDLELRTSNPGVAIGLAYTSNGGALTLIETTLFKGKGEIIITGNMGDIMKESVSTGLSWIKSNTDLLGLSDYDFSSKSIHVHVPQAAVPKDGPSAGITITISIVNLINKVYRFPY